LIPVFQRKTTYLPPSHPKPSFLQLKFPFSNPNLEKTLDFKKPISYHPGRPKTDKQIQI